MNIAVKTRSFHVFFRVAAYSDAKISRMCILQKFVKINSFVHIRNLTNQLACKFVSVFFGFKIDFAFYCISSQSHYVVYSQKIQIYQKVFGIFFAKPSTQDMWDRIYVIFVLDSSTNPYGSRTLFDYSFFQKSVGMFFVLVFFPMIGHIYKRGIKLHKRINTIKNTLNVLSF